MRQSLVAAKGFCARDTRCPVRARLSWILHHCLVDAVRAIIYPQKPVHEQSSVPVDRWML